MQYFRQFFSLNSVHKKPTITNCQYRKSTNWEEKVRTQGDYVTDMTFDKRKTASGEWSEKYGEWVGGCWFFALPCSCSLNSCMQYEYFVRRGENCMFVNLKCLCLTTIKTTINFVNNSICKSQSIRRSILKFSLQYQKTPTPQKVDPKCQTAND